MSINISNGTCYTAAGQKLAGSFVPCGNDAFGFQTCCGAGDNCLADNACFGIHGSGYGSFLTYFAGCTDPNYKDASCPKKVVNQPWVALTLCDNSDGAWAICSQSGNPTTLQPGSFCSCTNSASATVAFKDATVLANFASLPQSTGQTISFYAGHTPTASSTPTVASGTNKPTSSTSGAAATSSKLVTVSALISSFVSTLPGGALTTGYTTGYTTIYANVPANGVQGGSSSSSSKISTGTIVGIVVGALAALAAIVAFFFLLRRRSKHRKQEQRKSLAASELGSTDGDAKVSKQRDSDMSTVRPVLTQATTPPFPEADGQPVSELMGRPVSKLERSSELDGKETEVFPSEGGGLTPVAELPGSEPVPKGEGSEGGLRPDTAESGWSPTLEEAKVTPLNVRPKSRDVGEV